MGHIRVASSKVPWPSTNLGQSETTEYETMPSHKEPSIPVFFKASFQITYLPELSNGDLGLSLKQILLSSG